MTPERQFWIGVASANHVARGVAEGFMQVNHGKAAPLRRVRPGDGIAYYSPTAVFGEKTPLQVFTAIGLIKPGEVYQGDMGGGFTPFRRDVGWLKAVSAPIRPLLEVLELTRGRANWGYGLRFGLIIVSQGDFLEIAQAMGVDPAALTDA